jgi:hypothetical protein
MLKDSLICVARCRSASPCAAVSCCPRDELARASVEGARSDPTLIVKADEFGAFIGKTVLQVAVIAEMPPKVFRAMKCLSPLDPGAMGIIDQSANTSNHILFEQILVSAAIMIFI